MVEDYSEGRGVWGGMRILIHDYCGHPFQVELSRELARRGHEVAHLYCNSNPTTPKGRLARGTDDPSCFTLNPVSLPKDIEKGRFIDRWKLERLYGKRLGDAVEEIRPQVVMSANTPLDALAKLQDICRHHSIPFVFWVQDLIGEAATRILSKKLPLGGAAIGSYYRAKEKQLLRHSDAVVGITEDFVPYFESAGLGSEKISTIPNWSPLAEIVPESKDNPWSQRHDLVDKFVFLYSGTLGFKHNPGLFLELASKMRAFDSVRVVVNSQGEAADWLRGEAAAAGLSNLEVKPFQPYEEMSWVLGAADVLMAILERDAGQYSVPSKVLSYHCAARPMLLAVPPENLVSRLVVKEGSGLVCDPGDEDAFRTAASRLYADAAGRDAMARKARAYAERSFDVRSNADRFEEIFARLL